MYFFLLILLTFLCKDFQAISIPVYALYTPSHEILLKEFFLPSLQDPEIVLYLQKIEEQTCDSAKFMDAGWTKTTIKKIELVLQAIEDQWGEIFIFSDVDIQFFGSIASVVNHLMDGYDMLIQKDNPKGTLCSGFFVCRANEKIKALFSDVLLYMQKHNEISDQRTLNKHLSRNEIKNRYEIVWDYLPTESFFGGGTFTGTYWKYGGKLPIPRFPLMHHANWVRGIDGKIKQLTYVQNSISARVSSTQR
jgi:hypothetical protein